MSLDALTRIDIATPLGPVPLWSRPGALDSLRPVLAVINSPFVDRDFMSRAPQLVAAQADAVLLHWPGAGLAPALGEPGVEAFVRAVEAVIGKAFGARPLALAGFGLGATVALAVRTPQLRRVAAFEPVVETSGLWPLEKGLQRIHANAAFRPLIEAVYGFDGEAAAARDYRPLLAGLAAPAEVLVGAEALQPQRAMPHSPSLVGEPARQALAAMPLVRLRTAPGAGHNLARQAPTLVREVLDRAVAAAAGRALFDPALLARAPVAVASLAYVGDDAEGFAAAYRRRNPLARVEAAEHAAPPGRFDAVVVQDLGLAPPAVEHWLTPGGVLIAALRDGAELASLPPALAVRRLYPAAAGGGMFDDEADALAPAEAAGRGPLVLIAGLAARPAPEPLRIRVVSFARLMMDIRTRKPAEALRTDPQMVVAFHGAPFVMPRQPSVMILQRPGDLDVPTWIGRMRGVLLRRCLAVLEWDDHPDLIVRVGGLKATADDWPAFGFLHAVQTSTPELAAFFRRFNPEVRVFPNAVFDLAPFPERPRPRRVFYGATPRGAVSVEVARALAPAIAAVPELEFVVVGDRPMFDALPTARKTFHGYVSYEAYLDLMETCPVLISPIAPDIHAGKSDAKFLDAGSRGTLAIASEAVYGATIRHGETGLLARGLDDWAPLLIQALIDEDGSRAMARRAWDYVRRERMFAAQSDARRDWYRELMARREELDAGVLARLPGLKAALDVR